MKKVLIALIILIVLAGVWLGLRFVTGKSESPEPAACTTDAKLCSDGSYVARIPPKCDFAPCPSETLCEGESCPKQDLIQVESPGVNEVISSPLIVKGRARGFWFFEGDFPLVLTDWDGRIIAQGYATAQVEWMSEDFVGFEGMLEFEKPEHIEGVVNRGALILQKDNPSGLPEHDDALEIPIMFDFYEK